MKRNSCLCGLTALAAVVFGLSAPADQSVPVRFVDADGSVLLSEQVSAGECAYPPADPVRFGHDFAGWSDGTSVKSYAEIDRLPVAAATTWTATYAPHGARRIRVGVYSGPGANGTAALNYHRLFRNNSRFESVHVQTNLVQEGSIMDRIDLFMVPGGTTAKMYEQLGKAGRDNIAKFVQRDGGRYFGTCAGTAFQMNDNTGSHMGLAPYKLTSQDYHDAVTVSLTERGQAIFGALGWDGSVDNRIYYSGSPIMSDNKAGFKAGTYHFDVLAYYKQGLNAGFCDEDHYAIVAGTNYLGRLFLTGPHPEVYAETYKFISTGVRWLFDEGVARNGATAEELRSAATGITFALPTTGKRPRALRVAYGPASFTTYGADELLPLVEMIDQHPDYVLTPRSADNIKAGLSDYDVLVLSKRYRHYAPGGSSYESSGVSAFVAAGGKVLCQADGDVEVMRGLRAIAEARPVPLPGREAWGEMYRKLGAAADETSLAFTGTDGEMRWTVPADVTTVECLVIGGGGGGARNYGGGGGAGGCIRRQLTVIPGDTLTITVGTGGAGGVSGSSAGKAGGDSSVTGNGVSLVAKGGGGGGTAKTSGADGGSGGGAGGHGNSTSDDGKGAVYAGGAATDGQGSAGGSVTDFNGTGGAGGGGADGAGTGCATSGVYKGGAGGAGVTCDITGVTTGYAGGGGGGGGYASTAPSGGSATCGGGSGGTGVKGATTGGTGRDGKDGTGGGGGGGGRVAEGGTGGSGIVVIRYQSQETTPVLPDEPGTDDPETPGGDEPDPDVEYVGPGKANAFPVTFTFDDSIKSHVTLVAPLFKKYGWPAMFNVCLDHVGGAKEMTWDDIRSIREMGFDVAAHSITHGHLENMSVAKYTEEIVTSRDRVAEEVGVPPRYFCHPYTASSPAIERAIRAAGMKPMSLLRHAMVSEAAPGAYYGVQKMIEREMAKGANGLPMDILFHGVEPTYGGAEAMQSADAFAGMMAEVAELVKAGTIRIATYDEFYAQMPPSLGQKEAEPVERTVDGKTMAAVVPTHRPRLKAFAAKSAAERAAAMTDATTRTALAEEGDGPRPVAFTWFGDGEIAFTLKQGSKTVFATSLVGNAIEVGNLEVNQTYTWTVANANGSASGTFMTEDEAPRLVKDPDTGIALRELGGAMGMDAKRIRRQRVFRATGADFGDELVGAVRKVAVPDDFPTYGDIFTDTGKAQMKTMLEAVMNPGNHPLAFHSSDDDRTGTLAFVLGALLGADEDLLTLDWQLVALRNASTDVTMTTLDSLVNGFAAYEGTTLNDRVAAYVEAAGVPFATIAAFRNAMLEGGWAATMEGPAPVARAYAVEPLVNAGWGYQIVGLGKDGDEVALVFTNTTGALNWTLPEGVTNLRYLVVGGGGGGGSCIGNANTSGGGGGGGEVADGIVSVAADARVSALVGAGVAGAGYSGTWGKQAAAVNGNDSSFAVNDVVQATARGGRGGVAGTAGGNGGTPTRTTGGNGGDGPANDITGTSVNYGGGGGGGGRTAGGKGGLGGGGDGSKDNASGGNATAFGGGGGGSGNSGSSSSIKGGRGYQGVVIFRYGGATGTADPGDEPGQPDTPDTPDTPDVPVVTETVTTNALENGWGYSITGLGDDHRDVAIVFTNAAPEKAISWTVPRRVTSFDFLVVGGGGGGGGNQNNRGGGGGGAGGVVTGSVSSVSKGREYEIKVGGGGSGGYGKSDNPTRGGTGGESSICLKGDSSAAIRAFGGGGGGVSKSGLGSGVDGGCGGGVGGISNTQFGMAGGAATKGSVNEEAFGASYVLLGYNGAAVTAARVSGSGGGGAGAKGATGSNGGAGGAGMKSDITGEQRFYAGGGGGGNGNNNTSAGGAGGSSIGGNGGNKSSVTGTDGANMTGSGGGGGGYCYSAKTTGGNGGSGVVIVRYTVPRATGLMIKLR